MAAVTPELDDENAEINVNQILQAESNRYKSIEVKKDILPDVDLGNLLMTDRQPIEHDQFRLDNEMYLRLLARDNTQLLINNVWKLPSEHAADVIVAELPQQTTVIPREKPIPKPKPLTKWEQYAKTKGIKKRKRSSAIFDEKSKTWKRRWGYKSAKDDDDWVKEVPEDADPLEDQFAKAQQAKKERIAKNEFQRLRNISRKERRTHSDSSKKTVEQAIAVARTSTASHGVFTKDLPKEKGIRTKRGRRKLERNVGNIQAENEQSLKIIDKLRKPPVLNEAKAVNFVSMEKETKSNSKKAKKGKGKGGQRKNQKGKRFKHGKK